MYLLDTDISIYLLKGAIPAAAERLRGLDSSQVATTAITAAEIRYGAVHSARPKANLERVALFLAPLAVLPFDDAAAAQFASLKHDLLSTGRPIGAMDMLIAAIAIAGGHVLVTNNEREFRRVAGLEIENWTGGTK